MPLSDQEVRNGIKGGFALAQAICSTIRDAVRVPSGVLYTVLMDRMSLASYEALIGVILSTGLVEKSGDELVWVGQ